MAALGSSSHPTSSTSWRPSKQPATCSADNNLLAAPCSPPIPAARPDGNRAHGRPRQRGARVAPGQLRQPARRAGRRLPPAADVLTDGRLRETSPSRWRPAPARPTSTSAPSTKLNRRYGIAKDSLSSCRAWPSARASSKPQTTAGTLRRSTTARRSISRVYDSGTWGPVGNHTSSSPSRS